MKVIKLSAVFALLVLIAPLFSSRSVAVSDMIAFNFVDVEIPTVIKFISDITGDNFLFDDRIKGKITIIAPTELTIDEAFNLFTSVLNLKGYTIIPSGPKTYKIIPSSLAKQEGMISPDETVPVNEGYITKLIPLEHAQAEEVLQFFRPIVSRDGHISSFGPRNMLLIVDSALNIEKIMSILKLIDKPSVIEEEEQINVYFLEYADATDLAKVLQGIIKDLQTAGKNGRLQKQKSTPEAPPIISITPDKATNSLVVVSPPSDYQNILQVIKTLDKKRKQVYVEAMIVEASIGKLTDLGSKWRAMATHNDDPIAIGGVGNIDTGTILNIITGLSGFSVGGMGNFLDIPVTSVRGDGTVTTQTLTSPGFAALFSLSEFKGAVNVLSTPQILTSDNEEAEILVGENVPFISQRERDATTTNTVLNSIQRTDVGIKLKIKPQVTVGDHIKLDIFQEISSVKTASDNILITVGPTTTKRSTKTSVVVKDGRTVVIGGLMQEQDQESVFKLPILGDIPLLGWLFKFKSQSKNKTNLLVFLSPHIIKETSQLTKITEEKHREFVTQEKFYRQGELMVKFKEDVPEETALEIIKQHQATVIKYFKSINVYHIQLESGRKVEDAVQEFSSLPEVLYAEPNYKVKIPELPEDTDNQEPSPATDMNNPDSSIQKEISSALQMTDDEETSHAADVKKTFSSVRVEADLPDRSVDKKKISPAPFQVADEKIVVDADYNKGDGAAIKEVADPEQTQIPSASSHAEAKQYSIQVGAWINIKYALETFNKLKTYYPDIYIIEEGKFNKVRIPGTMSKEKDDLLLMELRDRFKLKPILIKNPK